MAIITISRGTFAGGEKLASLLGERLGYQIVSRELLYEKVREWYGFSLEAIAELLEQAPTSRVENLSNHHGRVSMVERRRQILLAVQASLCQLLRPGDVVYHGLSGHLLLPGISHVLRIRLIAPRAKRIELAVERERLTRDEARKKIDRVDSERSRWTQAFFGVNWGDPLLFDLVVNLERLSLEEACALCAEAAKLPRYRVTEDSAKKMEDLVLRTRVAALLSTDPSTSGLNLDVMADGGAVRLVGITDKGDLERVTHIIQKIEGVTKIDLPAKVD